LLLERKIFSSLKGREYLSKTRYLQAYVKYLKILKLAKKYDYHLANSERIRDLLKDCLNDMEMALEWKYGKRFRKHYKYFPKRQPKEHNHFWEDWMDKLADYRNQAIHRGTAFNIIAGMGVYYLIAESLSGKITQANEEVLPYLEKTLEKIRERLKITEI
jgi:hypothetical protein